MGKTKTLPIRLAEWSMPGVCRTRKTPIRIWHIKNPDSNLKPGFESMEPQKAKKAFFTQIFGLIKRMRSEANFSGLSAKMTIVKIM